MNCICKLTLLVFLAGLLSSCATMSPPQERLGPTLSWSQRVHQLSSLNHWVVKGNIAIRTPEGGLSTLVDWEQKPSKYVIRLLGSFGVGGVKLTGSDRQVILEKGHQERYVASTAEALMDEQMGWSLPVSGLYFWIRGLPAPGRKEEQTWDHLNRLQTLTQKGWRIEFDEYRLWQGYDFPGKITLRSGKVLVKIRVHQWFS